MKLAHLIGGLSIALMTATACSEGHEVEKRLAPDAPNLLLVTLDTVRADRLGAYGYEKADTPALDALATRGVLFGQAYSPAPMTLPAHSTLMTGLLPPQHGARVNGVHRLEDDARTLAEELREAGYRTGAFVAAFVLEERFGLAQGFDHFDDDLSTAYEQEVDNSLAVYRSGDQVVDAALSWLEEDAGEQPFFAWVHLYDAHFPWYAHAAESDQAEGSGTYDGEVAFVDSQLGRLVAWLEARDLVDETLVVAVADHGEGLGDHHEIEHAYLLNEEALHVPWIMAGPGCRAGTRVDALVALEDVQPTLLELLDLPGSDSQGRSLVAALDGGEIPSGVSYAETDLPWTSFRWAPQRSLTTADWKYIRTPQIELYDRTTDRGENANLAHVRKEVVKSMEGRLAELEKQLGQRSSAVVSLDSDELEQLAALGYVAADQSEVPADQTGLADVKERLHVKDLNSELRLRVARDTVAPAERIAICRQLVELSPETPAFHSQLGTALVDAGDYPAAIPAFERAVELAPTDPGLHYALGDALQQVGLFAEARPHLEMALELEPRMAAAHVGMGNVLRDEGRPDLAAGSYSEALRLRPDYPEAHYNLAVTFLDRNKPELALKQFEMALEQKPGWDRAHRSIASVMMSAGRWEEAAEHLQALLTMAPDSAQDHNDMGVALQRLGDPEQALRHYLAAMELAPDDYRPHLNRAGMAQSHGNEEIALAEYEAALERAPGHPEPAMRLARFLVTSARDDLRDGARAVTLAQHAVDATGGSSSHALETLARAYAAVGDRRAAREVASSALDRARAEGNQSLAQELVELIAGWTEEQSMEVATTDALPVDDG